MITHDELLSMWEADSHMDKHHLDVEALDVPKLHHKYLSILMNLKSKKIAWNHQLEDLKKEKEIYYNGQAPAHVYKEKPFDLKLKTKSGVHQHVMTDPEVVRFLQKIEYVDVLIEGCNMIIGMITFRNQTIKSAIDWAKFTSGEL